MIHERAVCCLSCGHFTGYRRPGPKLPPCYWCGSADTIRWRSPSGLTKTDLMEAQERAELLRKLAKQGIVFG